MIDQQVVDIPTVKTRIDRYKKAKAPIHSGNTIAELAADMGVNVKILEKTVADYNAAVKAGKAADLTPPNTLEKPRLLEKGPFLAFPFQGGMTATQRRKAADPGPLCRRQRHRRALLRRLHRWFAAHRGRHLGASRRPARRRYA